MKEKKILSENEIKAKVEYLSSARCNHTPHKYIDITGDLVAGTLLAQIMYWFAEGKNRVSVNKDGFYWITKRREDWMAEIRITKKQYDCAIKKLTGEIEPTAEEKKQKWNKGKRREKKYDMENRLVEVKTYHFYGVPTTHIRPITENINKKVDEWKKVVEEEIRKENGNAESPNLPNGNLANSLNGNLEISEEVNSYNIYNNINNTYTENTNRDYSSEITPNSFSNEKENSQETWELHNSHFPEEQKNESRISMSLGVKQKQSKEKPLRDMPTRAKEIADNLVDDTELSEGVQECIAYFLEKYKRKNRKEHLPLRNETLQSVVEVMLSSLTVPHDEDLENRYQCVFYPLVSEASEWDDRKEVIDKYFDTEFREKCDYSLVHFTQRDIITHVMQKCSIGEDIYWFYSESVD